MGNPFEAPSPREYSRPGGGQLPPGGPPEAIARARGAANLALILAFTSLCCNPCLLISLAAFQRARAARLIIEPLLGDAQWEAEVRSVRGVATWAMVIAGGVLLLNLAFVALYGVALFAGLLGGMLD